jgi:hypothetical protein
MLDQIADATEKVLSITENVSDTMESLIYIGTQIESAIASTTAVGVVIVDVATLNIKIILVLEIISVPKSMLSLYLIDRIRLINNLTTTELKITVDDIIFTGEKESRVSGLEGSGSGGTATPSPTTTSVFHHSLINNTAMFTTYNEVN